MSMKVVGKNGIAGFHKPPGNSSIPRRMAVEAVDHKYKPLWDLGISRQPLLGKYSLAPRINKVGSRMVCPVRRTFPNGLSAFLSRAGPSQQSSWNWTGDGVLPPCQGSRIDCRVVNFAGRERQSSCCCPQKTQRQNSREGPKERRRGAILSS